MTDGSPVQKISPLKVWLQAGRVWAAPASLVSVFLGAALALSYGGEKEIKWFLLPIVAICGFLYHFAANIISDVYDYKNQVDKNYTFGGSGVLTGGMLTADQAYKGGWAIFAFASLLGLALVYFQGLPVLILGIAGLLGAFFYCAAPVGYKYYGLGDIAVFIFFGTLLTLGSYMSLTGDFSWTAIVVSIPAGSLIAAILSANNNRDIKHDTEAGITTMESMLGIRGGILLYKGFIVLAYLSVIAMVMFKVVPVWALVVLLSIPLAIKNIRAISSGEVEHPERIAHVDVMTAQLHAAFGTLLIISLAISAWVMK
jgi:1,4-dihydroxy-2-naphthoate polyprenyltransferase